MTNVSLELPPPTPPSTVDLTQEIRFAVVMYGGSSLAIYMNGVAQEMLRLVRATAPDPDDASKPLIPDEKLSGSERVYRRLGKILNRGGAQDLDEDTPIRTRFVIDILSGTSAGGINAVFLAKALANDQDINPLRNLWVKQGDMGVLINDKESDKDIKIGPQDPPRSLLSSRRMYYELLDALEGMDKAAHQSKGSKSNDGGASPYVDELDLFTTATDIWGQVISMRLADNVAMERRHLNKFRFSYNSTQNDFKRDNNPFLAFAARCTSAHPAPFEPMKLSDINEILDKHEDYRNRPNLRSDDKRWRPFFEEYLQHAQDGSEAPRSAKARAEMRDLLAKKFEKRPFSDGGVLDNSPFSFAIDKIQFRHTKLPVDRKLLYIEPVPEHPERQPDPEAQPNALANGWLSLSVLPRYQFIREDLERVLQRNQLIERVNGILKGIEKDEIERLKKHHERKLAKKARKKRGEKAATEGDTGSTTPEEDHHELPLSSYAFATRTLDEMIERMGSAWGGYQRLRVAETTDELVKVISAAAGFDEDSDEFLAIRYLVRTWRNQKYDPYGKKDPVTGKVASAGEEKADKISQSWFLFQYDLKWRLRRLKFVLNRIDEIACMDDRTTTIMRITRQGRRDFSKMVEENPAKAKEFRDDLQELKEALSAEIKVLDDKRRLLLLRTGGESSALTNPLGSAITAVGLERDELLDILKKPTEDECTAAAHALLSKKEKSFNDFLIKLDNELKTVMEEVSARVRGRQPREGDTETQAIKGILDVSELSASNHSPEIIARSTLRYYYENFDRYDMISYPILYSTKVGEETDPVEIFRISPEDAGFLIKDKAMRSKKLAGTSLGNFGAFFDEQFRTNDILWGRLDCADRLVTALLSSSTQTKELVRTKAELIREASRAIIAEELSAEEEAGLRGLLAAALKNTREDETNEVFLAELEKRLTGNSPDLSKMQDFLKNCLKGTDPLDDFIATSKFEHELPPETMVRTSARASRVFGRMLEGIAEDQRFNRKHAVWFTRITHLFWGLVEVAVPGSIGNLLLRHWLKLLYFFEVLLVLGGTLLLNSVIQQFGFIAFAVTGMIHLLVKIFSDLMAPESDRPRRRLLSQKSVREKLSEATGIQLNAAAAEKLVERFEIYETQPASAGTTSSDVSIGQQKRALPWHRRSWAWTRRTFLRPTLRVLLTASVITVIALATLGLFFVLAIYGSESASSFVQRAIRPDMVEQVVPPAQAGQVASAAAAAAPTEPNNFRLALRWSLVAVVVLVFLGTLRESLKGAFREKRKRGVRALGITAGLLGILLCFALAKSFLDLRADNLTLPGNLHLPALALEMAQSPADVAATEQTIARMRYNGDVRAARKELKEGVTADFFFILVYTLINLWFCYWLWQRNIPGAKILAVAAVVLSILTAAGDIWENLRLYDVLNDQRTPEILKSLGWWTLFKWATSFATVALFSALFLRRRIWFIGVLFLLVAGLGFYGLAVPVFLEAAFAAMGLVMIAAGLLMTIRPDWVVDGLRPLPEPAKRQLHLTG